ncbi:unnamed protein product [Aphanomyces euteiches]
MDAARHLLWLRVGLALSFAVCMWRNAALGPEMGASAARHPCILTPERSAFSIWPVIYLFLSAFTLRECLAPSTSMPLDQLTWLYRLTIVSHILNATWIQVFTADYIVVSTIVIVIHWLVVFAIYMIVVENVEPPHLVATLSVHRDENSYLCTSRLDFLTLRVPFTLYSSWLCGATLINILIGLASLGMHQEMYMYISALSLLLMAYIIALLWQGDLVFAGVGVWTLVWLEIQSANKKLLVLEDTEKYAEITAIQVMATLGLSIIVALTVLLIIIRCRAPARSIPLLAQPHPPPTYGAVF